ncbi:MAG: hypothetical protein AAF196_02790 [Planctomycetota bacterium]
MRRLSLPVALVFAGSLGAQGHGHDHVHADGEHHHPAPDLWQLEDVLALDQNRPSLLRRPRRVEGRSGSGPLKFEVGLTAEALPAEVFEPNPHAQGDRPILRFAHGGFAYDHREGHGDVYWFLQGAGILRVPRGADRVELVETDETMLGLNMHNATFFEHEGEARIAWPAEGAGRVFVTDPAGQLLHTIGRPTVEQYAGDGRFAPTDTAYLDGRLWVTDGYGSRFVTAYDLGGEAWTSAVFGGHHGEPGIGRFGTNHGITVHRGLLWVSGRYFALIHSYRPTTEFASMFALPAGSKPCDFEFFVLDDRLYGVAASLNVSAGAEGTGAAIYIVDMSTLEIVSTVRPKDELGLENFVHLHNVFPVVEDGRVRLFCQAWNPGDFAVLEQVVGEGR